MPKLDNADKTAFCHLLELTIFRTLMLTTTSSAAAKTTRHEKTDKIIILNKASTHGSFILMNTRHVKKDTKTHTKPRKSRRNLFSLDMPTALDLSKMMKPNPPMEKRKLDAKPSMMY